MKELEDYIENVDDAVYRAMDKDENLSFEEALKIVEMAINRSKEEELQKIVKRLDYICEAIEQVG